MNSRQITHLNTRNSGQCPWKNPQGENQFQGDFIIELQGKISELQQQQYQHLIHSNLSPKSAHELLENRAKLNCLDFCALYGHVQQKCSCTTLNKCAQI
jgi:hypothetical protein